MARGKKGEAVDRHKSLADELRKKSGVEWRDAIMADRRVEFIRGKDFAAYFRQHEDKLAGLTSSAKIDVRIKELGDLFLRRRYLVKAERMFKKPKPGKKRLVKFPKKLIPLMNDQSFQEEFFYAWQYDREASPWLYVFSALIVVVVIAACLFPLAPYPVRLAVVYLSMALLSAILGIIVVRSIIAAISWVGMGRSLWLFPYLLSEDKGIDEAFWPIFQLDKVEEGKGSHWSLRLLFALVIGVGIYGSYTYAPDRGAVRDATKHAHDAILEMLNLHDAGMSKLGSGAANESTAAPGRPKSSQGPAGQARSGQGGAAESQGSSKPPHDDF